MYLNLSNSLYGTHFVFLHEKQPGAVFSIPAAQQTCGGLPEHGAAGWCGTPSHLLARAVWLFLGIFDFQFTNLNFKLVKCSCYICTSNSI